MALLAYGIGFTYQSYLVSTVLFVANGALSIRSRWMHHNLEHTLVIGTVLRMTEEAA